MSFSGRRVSILRPSNRRFSVGKELSNNGACLGFFAFPDKYSRMSILFFFQTNTHRQNSSLKPTVNFEPPTKATVPMQAWTRPVPLPVSSGVPNVPLNTAS